MKFLAVALLTLGLVNTFAKESLERKGSDDKSGSDDKPYVPKMFKTAANNQSIALPAKNAIFLCSNFGSIAIPNGFKRLYRQNSSWVKGDYIIVEEMLKIKVPGVVSMKPEFKVTKTSSYRHLEGNGIPNHQMGTYPIVPGSKAYDIYSQLVVQGYPNAAAIPVYPYNLSVYLPMNPTFNEKPFCLGEGESIVTGVSTQTGAAWHMEVALAGNDPSTFQAVDPSDALPLDLCFGHPYYGQYHYHMYSWKCFPNQGTDDSKHSPLYGYAMDGFGIYGPRSLKGKLVTNDDLDECHGHSHKIKWDGKEVDMYHYHLNNEYPYSVGCYRGTPYFVGNSPLSLQEGSVELKKDASQKLSHEDKIRLYEELTARGDTNKLQDRILMGN